MARALSHCRPSPRGARALPPWPRHPEPIHDRRKPPLLLFAFAGLWIALVFLARQMPPDGHERGNWGQFLGRFHPILVHLPVALLLLVPLMELLAFLPRWAHLRAAAGWVLAVAVVATFAAAFDGWLLAWSTGLRGHEVTLHMWGGVLLAGACALASHARSARWRGRGIPGLYPLSSSSPSRSCSGRGTWAA